MKAVLEGAEMDAPGDRGGWKHESPSDMELEVHHTEVKVVCMSGPLSLYFHKDGIPYSFISVQHILTEMSTRKLPGE
jgi:hypothetical protein